MLDVAQVKKDFPILNRKVNEFPLVYLDNAATSQKPQAVIDSIVEYYQNHNANVHRGIHTLSEEATQLYENARDTVKDFLGATTSEEIIFTKGATEGLNFVAATLGAKLVSKGDIILTTPIEHHSNLVPWQQLVQNKGATLDFIQMTDDGEINWSVLETQLTAKVKIIAITHASNVLGTIIDIKKVSKLAHKAGALVVVDGAQAAPHVKVNVQSIDCDAYAISAHKMLGPTGIGALWVKKELLESIEPYQFGGGMIETVELQTASWAEIPQRFEAGTPHIAGAVGFAAAIDYLNKIGMENIKQHEEELNKYALAKLSKVAGLTIYGPKDYKQRTGLVAFTLKGIHPHDVAAVLNSSGIAVRAGHHCAHPLHQKLDISSTIRASYYLYNSTQDIDKLIEGLDKARQILGA